METEFYGSLVALRSKARDELQSTSVYDAVLTPTLAQPPARVGSLRDDSDPERDFDNQKKFSPFTAPYNLKRTAGYLDSVVLDCRRNTDRCAADRPTQGDEVTLLRLAAQLEAAEPWVHRKPACW